MNLGYITKRYDVVGGTEKDLYELTRRLAAKGHAIHVYCHDVRTESPPGVTIHRIPRPGPGRRARALGLAQQGPAIATRGEHDLVISYAKVLYQDIIRCEGGLHRGFLKEMAAIDSPFKRLLRRLDPYHRSVLAIEEQQYKPGNYLAIQAISNLVAREIVETFSVNPDRVKVIHSGVDLDSFHPRQREKYRSETRRTLGIPEGALTLLFLGNGFKRKGLESFLRAVAALDAEQVHGVVVGTDAAEGAYRDLARDLGIGDRVHFTGVSREPTCYYASSDIFILPSLQEAFGNVVLEAMASGLPVIVSARAGASEILAPPLSEFVLCEPRDIQEMVAKVRLLADDAVRGERGREARRQAEGYSLDQHAQRIEAHYAEVLAWKHAAL